MTLESPPLPDWSESCLFLDVDGTLVDLAPTPDAVAVENSLRDLLRELERRCNGAVALITGRTIADVDELFDPLFLAVAGVHGCERRTSTGDRLRPAFLDPRFPEFREKLREAVSRMPALLFEDKDCAIALHYRRAPQLEAPLRGLLARMKSSLPDSYELLEGDEVFEFKPTSHDKASAIEAFMQEPPFAGRVPVFIGDDLTDQDGFAAVRRHGGLAIAVGDRVNASWRLSDTQHVRRWLGDSLAASRP